MNIQIEKVGIDFSDFDFLEIDFMTISEMEKDLNSIS